jgi:hypothetical protein
MKLWDQVKAKDPEWHEATIDADIDIFKMSYEKPVSYFKSLENLKKIRLTNCPGPATLPVDDKRTDNFTISVGKYSNKPFASSIWCHYYEKYNNNMTDCRAIVEFKQQLKSKLETERILCLTFGRYKSNQNAVEA